MTLWLVAWGIQCLGVWKLLDLVVWAAVRTRRRALNRRLPVNFVRGFPLPEPESERWRPIHSPACPGILLALDGDVEQLAVHLMESGYVAVWAGGVRDQHPEAVRYARAVAEAQRVRQLSRFADGAAN